MSDADKLRAQKAASTDPARLEREAKRAEEIGPRNEPRPWSLRMRRASWRTGEFMKWRTHATYKSKDAADAAVDALQLRWTGAGYRIETEVTNRHALAQRAP